jgi:hypothetical protein
MATAAQQRVEALETQVNRIQVDFGTFKAALDQQRVYMEDEIQKGFAEGRNDVTSVLQAASTGFDILKKEIGEVVNGARDEFQKNAESVNLLYHNADAAVKELRARLELLEGQGGQGQGQAERSQRGYLPTKNTIPKNFDNKLEDWRQWKDDVLDFFDENNKGMRSFLVEIQKEENIDELWLQGKAHALGEKIAGRDEGVRVWKALKGMTTGEARKVGSTR